MSASRFLRGVPGRGGDDPGPPPSARLVLAEVAAGLPVRGGSAVPDAAPDPDQPESLAGGEVALDERPVQAILAVHLRGLDGMCVGCRAWWSQLSPHPCWQFEWATSRRARASTTWFLGGLP
ncbi:hypothetical protein DLJ47_10625 [Micromonospora sp. S4605]|uniref:hypothetical protein n=1 Tax=Micromonospora sp. S4605 TaxID=1420897 RepID=UPI000D70092E|nr:hypothetical protein DLJ47_10625 [Micromonospora sp. S4605]